MLWTGRSSATAAPPRIKATIAAVPWACGELKEPPQTVGLCVPGTAGRSQGVRIDLGQCSGTDRLAAYANWSCGRRERATRRPVVVNDANATAYDIYSTRQRWAVVCWSWPSAPA